MENLSIFHFKWKSLSSIADHYLYNIPSEMGGLRYQLYLIITFWVFNMRKV